MPELLVFLLLAFVLGLLMGSLMGFRVGRVRSGYCADQEHEFAHLRGAFGYCLRCPAKRRFL